MTKNYVTKDYFDLKLEQFEKIMNRILEKLDWLIEKYQGHDEEHILINGKLSDHSDRLETREEKMGITV